jgi:hypothetical protein
MYSGEPKVGHMQSYHTCTSAAVASVVASQVGCLLQQKAGSHCCSKKGLEYASLQELPHESSTEEQEQVQYNMQVIL